MKGYIYQGVLGLLLLCRHTTHLNAETRAGPSAPNARFQTHLLSKGRREESEEAGTSSVMNGCGTSPPGETASAYNKEKSPRQRVFIPHFDTKHQFPAFVGVCSCSRRNLLIHLLKSLKLEGLPLRPLISFDIRIANMDRQLGI